MHAPFETRTENNPHQNNGAGLHLAPRLSQKKTAPTYYQPINEKDQNREAIPRNDRSAESSSKTIPNEKGR
jgi:hypothetical protein